MHPYNTRDDLIALCQKNGIVVNSYSPLGGKGNEDQVGLGWQGVVPRKAERMAITGPSRFSRDADTAVHITGHNV